MLPVGRILGCSRTEVPKNIWTKALMTEESPMVTMMTLMAFSPTSGRRTNRSTRTPRTMAPNTPTTLARIHGRPKMTNAV